MQGIKYRIRNKRYFGANTVVESQIPHRMISLPCQLRARHARAIRTHWSHLGLALHPPRRARPRIR